MQDKGGYSMSIRMAVLALSLPIVLLACNRTDPAQTASSPAAPADLAREETSSTATPSQDSPAVSQEEADAIGRADTPSATAANETQPCSAADVELTEARHKEYLKLVAGAMDNKVKPKSVKIVRFMGTGAWSTVFATTPLADPGWFVFESSVGHAQFKDVWGGMALEEDRPGLVAWATALGAPADFSGCFAEVVIN
jgi:hypothetical protein